jgi:hypothetical protein
MFFSIYFILFVVKNLSSVDPSLSQTMSQRVGPRSERSAAREPAPWSGQRSVLSIYVAPDETAESQRTLEVRGKIDRGLNNLEDRILVAGVVGEDVVSGSGNIIIPAGSKVVGLGYCDAGRGRIMARGHWTFYVSDHQITLEGSLWGNDQREGLPGLEAENGADPDRVKQAIYRDGIYLYVPAATDFVLRLTGNISVRDLGSAFGK